MLFKFDKQMTIRKTFKEEADHLREERLPIHIQSCQVDTGYVQNGGSQVNIQH